MSEAKDHRSDWLCVPPVACFMTRAFPGKHLATPSVKMNISVVSVTETTHIHVHERQLPKQVIAPTKGMHLFGEKREKGVASAGGTQNH